MSAPAGIDIAEEFHWLAVVDDRGRPLLHHRVDNDPNCELRTAACEELLDSGVGRSCGCWPWVETCHINIGYAVSK